MPDFLIAAEGSIKIFRVYYSNDWYVFLFVFRGSQYDR